MRPIRRKIRELIGLRKRQRIPSGATIELWLGISTDEAIRMRTSRDRWIRNRYPLIEARMSRQDCELPGTRTASAMSARVTAASDGADSPLTMPRHSR